MSKKNSMFLLFAMVMWVVIIPNEQVVAEKNLESPEQEVIEEETIGIKEEQNRIANVEHDTQSEMDSNESILENEEVQTELIEEKIEEVETSTDNTNSSKESVDEYIEDNSDSTNLDQPKQEKEQKESEEKLNSSNKPVVKPGDNNQAVLEMKLNLGKLGFVVSSNPNTVYGSKTEDKVKEFQGKYGLKVTGIADHVTLAKIEELVSNVEVEAKPESKTPEPKQIQSLSYSVIKRGDNNHAVLEMKQNLSKLGFAVSTNPNTVYGPKTEEIVKDFQSVYGLKVTGTADEKTLTKIEELLENPFGTLKPGDNNQVVLEMKQNLARLGFKVSNNPNTVYGPKTADTVKDFQRKYGLPVTGIADGNTLAKIGSLLKANGNKPVEDLSYTLIKPGDNHQAVLDLKKKLAKLGFKVSNNPNTVYGPKTTETVKKFQKVYGLKVTGTADEKTLKKLADLLKNPDETIKTGDNNQAVLEMKQNLAKLGFAVSNNPNTVYGPKTADTVRDFQRKYGLPVTGIADGKTLAKIDELIKLLNNELKAGDNNQAVLVMKQKLAKLGFKVSNNPNTVYGPKTVTTVREFQSYYGLKQTGKMDASTATKMEELLSSPLRRGQDHKEAINLKNNLSRLGFHITNKPTTHFGPSTESTVKEFQSYYGLVVNGIADKPTLNKINELLTSPLRRGQDHKEAIALKNKLSQIGFHITNNPTTHFGPSTELKVKEFQKAYGLPVSGIADKKTLEAINKAVKNNVVKIFLDPGHGGKDPGAIGHGLKEKDVVLDIALKTADVLSSKFLGVDIMLSRTTDKFIELIDRSKMANEWKADYFVSFHTNSFNGSAKGFESYIYNGSTSAETKERQKVVHDYMSDRINTSDRGKKKANFNVLRNTDMPAILLEYMFIDNYNENKLLKDASYRTYLGRITAEAIAKSFNLKAK